MSLKESPLFSVLVANYNNGQYLEECLQSIFAQTYQNWEIVIVDDASADNSHAIYEKYKTDPRIRILKNDKNRGCGYTKRKCVEYAEGDICGFVDPDDIITNNAIGTMINLHQFHPLHSIIYSTHYNCNQYLEPEGIAEQVGQIPEGKKSWMIKRPIISQFATFKRELYFKTYGIFPWLPKAVDKSLYYNLEESGPVLFINQPLYYYRHHDNSISLNKGASIAYQFHLAIKALLSISLMKNKSIFELLPHSKNELAGGLVIAGLYTIKKTSFKADGISLLYKTIRYFPIQSVTFILIIIKKILVKGLSKVKRAFLSTN